MNFEELSSQRHALQDFCQRHAASVLAFKYDDGPGFKLTANEEPREHIHLTTTATCIESLLACPGRYRDAKYDALKAAKDFARVTIERADWTSELSARIYCRCRGLPITIDHLDTSDVDGPLAGNLKQVAVHVERILRQLKHDPGRFAIGEADIENEEDLASARKAWYPPNAFHTFWTLRILRQFKNRFPHAYDAFQKNLQSQSFDIQRIKDGMLLWSRRTLGYQVSLHAAESSILDSDQLAWSLATLLEFADPPFPSDLGEQDLLREALKRLFGTQLQIGTWRHYRSIFHYEKVGNAYCYVYETFAALLTIALADAPGRKLLRDTLHLYVDKLMKLWGYAESTRIPLKEDKDVDDPGAVGWCSGHRLHHTAPESWATASVLSFAQALRRLLGVWTREAARKQLNLVKPVLDEEPEDALKERGDTWTEDGKPTVTQQLYAMFINPVLKYGDGDSFEPDTEPIQKHQARSAILFGVTIYMTD